ncbi:MAG TPA: hypothetical protein VJ804_12405, partial [Acidimicrobiales bacterium]|nr:hypothetical protein [Acidimicrobiales bacterium]
MPRRPSSHHLLARAVLGVAVVAAMAALVVSRVQEAEEVPAALRPTTTSSSTTTTTAPASTTVPTTTTVPFDPWILRPPAPAGDAAGLAAQILAAETAIRDPATPPTA